MKPKRPPCLRCEKKPARILVVQNDLPEGYWDVPIYCSLKCAACIGVLQAGSVWNPETGEWE
jgi:hypothetical protein